MMEIKTENLPKHIAIIMDGNGRWAKGRNLSRSQGHVEGVRRVEEIIDYASEIGIKVITLFTFSTENWKRPEDEVSLLMNIVDAVLNKKAEKLKRMNMRFQVIGRRKGIPEQVLKSIEMVEEKTADNDGLTINLAFNYGSRVEIVDAVQAIALEVKGGTLPIEAIDENVIDQHLYTANLPDPDLLIRTSGEKRISNFLLWQLSYAEFYFSEKYWPDFTIDEFNKALKDFEQRERRFGNLTIK